MAGEENQEPGGEAVGPGDGTSTAQGDGAGATTPTGADATAAAAGESAAEPAPDPAETIARLEAEAKAARDRLLYALADLDNLRKRARREAADAEARGGDAVVREMLPVVDNLERALAHMESPPDGADPAERHGALIEGVRMVHRQFLAALERAGVRPYDSGGERFDPELHEALSQAETADAPPGTVVQELARGYRRHGRVLRAAMVVVARAPAAAAAPAEESAPGAGAPVDPGEEPGA